MYIHARQAIKGRGNKRLSEPLSKRTRRFFSGAVKTAAIAVVIGAAVYGAWWIRAIATASPYLAISSIKVSGVERITRGEVLSASGIRTGDNMFGFSASEAEARIKDNPWVNEAVVRRTSLGAVSIEISERRPVALIRLDDLYVMDASGTAFKRYSGSDALDLPVITGLERAELKEDATGLSAWVVALLSALSQRRGFSIADVSEIHADKVFGLSVYTDDGVRLDLGVGRFEEKLSAYEKILKSRGSLRGIEAIDLNNTRGVVVKFADMVV
ncbi:MAG: FtsQ-type POTRA domain-containing protein [Deltaproteobacteria bacterium]|nr:FtsQ-type POTRA domain-containing protein [Deltaproteobacteria bacterium]